MLITANTVIYFPLIHLLFSLRKNKDILPWTEIEKVAEKSAIVDKIEVGILTETKRELQYKQ